MHRNRLVPRAVQSTALACAFVRTTLTEDGARRAEEWRVKSADGYSPRGLPAYLAASPDDLRPYDRCITRGVLGSAVPNQYGSGMQIHQAPGVVVIRYEMVHEAPRCDSSWRAPAQHVSGPIPVDLH